LVTTSERGCASAGRESTFGPSIPEAASAPFRSTVRVTAIVSLFTTVTVPSAQFAT
jgi:hypothetical protein